MMRRRIECGVDKAAVVDRLLLKKAAGRPGSGGDSLSVYVGDSMSDLAPLLSVDLGIVIGQNKLLRRVAKGGGVTLRPLVAGEPGLLKFRSVSLFITVAHQAEVLSVQGEAYQPPFMISTCLASAKRHERLGCSV